MSTFFELRQAEPIISSNNLFGITGEKIIISGEAFKKNILQISGQSIFNSDLFFNVYGQDKQNISGINNTIYEDAIEFTIPTGVSPSKYNLYLFNSYGKSSNFVDLHIVDRPRVSGIDFISGFPFQYIRVSGTNFYPSPNLKLFDNEGVEVSPTYQDSGLYKLSSVELTDFGTGYNVGEIIYFSGLKTYLPNTAASLEVTTTGISGSLASFNILNSGIFTIPDLSMPIELVGANGRDAKVSLEYEKYLTTEQIEFIEFQVPLNIRGEISGVVENLKYKDIVQNTFTGFKVIGIPYLDEFFPRTGTVDSTSITISGDNLSFIDKVYLDDLDIQFNKVGNTGINFLLPNYAETNKIFISGKYGSAESVSVLNVLYPSVIVSGFSPNDILLGTGASISISGKYLQRTNYINIGQQNLLRNKISVVNTGTRASFSLPDNYKTTELRLFSQDFPNSGTLISSSNTNNLLIASVKLNPANVNIRYLSGVQGAKYLDQIEIYSPTATSGDYGNLSNSDIYFLSITGLATVTGSYLVSGIKESNTATGIRIRIPKEVKNPQARIKIKRNKFNDEYLLSSEKSIDIFPTIFDVTPSNTLYNSLGYITISGINASSVNQIYFSGYSGTKNIFGFKDINYYPLEIVSKNVIQITGGDNTTGYTVIEAKLGGDITGSGELFLYNTYYDTGIGYENLIITRDRKIKIANISGYRPPNSDIFTSPSIVTNPLDQAFFYQIQTTSRATSFEISATTLSGVGEEIFPPGISPSLNSSNQIYGVPTSGGNYYIKIRALDGEKPNEGMILQANFGSSGRSLAGPGIVYRGEWDPSIGYVADNVRRDVVKYPNGANYWYAAITNINSIPGPSNINWIAFSNEFSATATQILLAEQSNITSLVNVGRLGIPSGIIKSVNDIDSNLGSGFFLGYDNTDNPYKPKFRVGNSENYIKFNGLGLDIVGPLSGILTTSRDITNANNVVRSNHSVALGLNNVIETGSDNVFIFGTSNFATGTKRSSIVAGQDNLITGLDVFNSEDSNIVGGKNNKIIGSFCNIGGGRANVVDALSTGLAGIGNQIFSVPVTGQQILNIKYPLFLYTNQLAVLHNIEKTGEEDFYDIKYGNITSTSYDVEFANILDTEDLTINLLSWVSILSENLYSGSFQEDDKVCQFKVFKTGINAGNKDVKINFNTPFVDTDDLIVLNTIQSQDFYKNYITGIDRSGFNIVFSKNLDENVIVHFFAGNKGYFTGVNENSGKILEIGSIKPFNNMIFGTGVHFDIPIARASHVFQNVFKPDSNDLYIAKIRETGKNILKIKLNNDIDSSNEYIFLDAVSYTGTIINDNLQVYSTGLSLGNSSYTIDLLSGYSSVEYIPIIDEMITGENFYPYSTSNHGTNTFDINFGANLLENIGFNIGIYRSGRYPFDSGYHYASSTIISGVENTFDIPFNLTLNKKPEVLFNLQNINETNYYIVNIQDITKTGFSIKLSKNLNSGERVRVNYLAVEGTGYQEYSAVSKILGYENYTLSNEIVIGTENSASAEVKVFGRATSNNNLYYNIFTSANRSRFNIKISDNISGQELLDLNYDYIITDLTRDLVLTRNFLGESSYGRLAGFGFDDVGSSTIGGGTGNYIKGLVSVIGGGVKNIIFGDYNVIPGGRSNIISDFVSEIEAPKTAFCGVLAGNLNIITGSVQNAVIVGGERNYIQNTDRSTPNESLSSAILGGKSNVISGSYSAIVGGSDNIINGSYSYGVGRNININQSGCLVLGDSTTSTKRNLGTNTLTMHFASGIYITGVNPGVSPIHFDVNNIPTSSVGLPRGAIYVQSGTLKIVS
jgi:hypothetical protein